MTDPTGVPMGMFDHLRCAYPLPVPAAQDCEFQTKSFDCPSLDTYVLRADGTLWHVEYDIEDRSDPTATGLMRFAGEMTRVNPREVPCDHSGEVIFKTSYGRRNGQGREPGWVEFVAQFEHGRLTQLDIGTHKEPPEEVAKRAHDVLDVALPATGKEDVRRRL